MNTRFEASAPPVTRLFLDHGADEAVCQRFQIEENGATFVSPSWNASDKPSLEPLGLDIFTLTRYYFLTRSR